MGSEILLIVRAVNPYNAWFAITNKIKLSKISNKLHEVKCFVCRGMSRNHNYSDYSFVLFIEICQSQTCTVYHSTNTEYKMCKTG